MVILTQHICYNKNKQLSSTVDCDPEVTATQAFMEVVQAGSQTNTLTLTNAESATSVCKSRVQDQMVHIQQLNNNVSVPASTTDTSDSVSRSTTWIYKHGK